MGLPAYRRRTWRKRVILALVAVAVLGLMPALSGSAAAASGPMIGAKLSLLNAEGTACRGPFDRQADTSFYVAHGWVEYSWTDLTVMTPEYRRGVLHPTTFFALYVEGVRMPSMAWMAYDRTQDWFYKGNITNFAGGLGVGSYTFHGFWYRDGSLEGGAFGQAVLILDCEVEVTFVG